MSHSVPAALLLLALAIPASASRQALHAKPLAHHVTAKNLARKRSPAVRHGNPGPRQATPADFDQASLHQQHPPPERTAGQHDRRRQAARDLHHLRREVHLKRARQVPQPAPLRGFAPSLQPAVRKQVTVVSVIRSTSEPRPQLPLLADAVTQPVILPTLGNQRGHPIMPAALVGSHEILLHQNEMADADGLGRVQNDADLNAMRARGMLVPLPASFALAVDDRLPVNRRFSRPWTAIFLNDLARAHYARFHTALQVNSAVRTVEFQHHLIRINGNAAPADGDTASPHLTGQAVDLAKRGMPLPEIAWMRGYLLPLIQDGKIDVEEEFQQSCFHVSVYKRYLPASPDRYTVASRASTSSLAAVLR